MKVTCPNCHYENQVNASSQARVVCARCATIFEATSQTETTGSNSFGQTAYPPLAASASVTPSREPYSTRFDSEFDEILDIPLTSPGNYQAPESDSVFEDVFTNTGSDFAPIKTDVAPPVAPPVDVRVTAPLPERAHENIHENIFEELPETPTDSPMASFESLMLPKQNGHTSSAVTSWPVLPGEYEDFSAAVQPSSSGSGVWKRVALVVLVFSVLFAALYYFVIMPSKQNEQASNQAVNNQVATNQNANSAGKSPATNTATNTADDKKSATAPNAGAGTDTKASGTAENKVAPPPSGEASKDTAKGGAKDAAKDTAKKDQPVAGASTSGKTSPAETGKAAPGKDNKNSSTAPSTTKPAPLQVPFGHSVKPGEGSFTLQVAAFSEIAQANDRSTHLKSSGIDARVVKAEIPNKGTWYRVQIGRFTSREEALRYGNQLKARGAMKEFIVTGYQQ